MRFSIVGNDTLGNSEKFMIDGERVKQKVGKLEN